VIAGVVNARLEAIIRLRVQATDGSEHDVQAVLDTGFNGSLTLPSAVIAILALPWRGRNVVTLANGARERCNLYGGKVIWDGAPRTILIEAADTDPLIGMALVKGYDLHIEVRDGGAVALQALP
jgi:clan AA aspartic protease